MRELRLKIDALVQQKNDMELKVASVDKERADLDQEYKMMVEMTSQE